MKKEESNWHSKSKETIFKEINSSKQGLTQTEANSRLKTHGKNILKKKTKLTPLKIFISQFKSFLIYILIVAAAISFYIGHNIDGIVISAIVLLNAVIGFTQQYKAEKAIINLRKILVPKSRVIREGIMKEIPSRELVPGDIVVLSAGDKINADCRIIEAENSQTNEAVLTGESMPVEKLAIKLKEDTPLAEHKNMLYTGTELVSGNAKALVVATGMKTHFGQISESLQEIEIQKTPMQKRLDKFSKQVGIVILIFVALVMLLGITEHFDALEMFLTAIALAVSAIPEGLPAVLTLSFAISSVLMSKSNVIIRRLPAVESLGSVTVICSDKTGTITEEKMTLQKIFSNNNFYNKKQKNLFFRNKKINLKENKTIQQLIKTSILCNNSRFEKIGNKYELIGDPTEKALLEASLDLGFNKKSLIEAEPSIKKFEFDSKRKLMSIARSNQRNTTLYSKGAPEKIISICASELINGEIKKLTDKRKEELINSSNKMEQEALRVLGFAYKNFSKKEKIEERGLIFLGFAGMIDPPRKEVKDAIEQAKSAGIKIKMITGDSLLTANAISSQIGIIGKAITGEELEKLSDNALKNSINEIAIFARTTPHQKLRITKILQDNNETVAITGDGINDSMALKSADIGIAMGQRGTDVSRDVSDIILVDDNFASIIKGVSEGRKTYDNVKKFTKYFLAVNFDEILLVVFALLMRVPLPLIPLQILWINLITDSFPALSLVFEKQENVMKTKPRQEKSILDGIWKFVIIAGVFAFIIGLSIYLIGTYKGFSIEKIRTMVLTTTIFYELLFIYTCRSKQSLLKTGIFSNKWLNYAVVFSLALHLVLLYTPLASLFGVVPLTIKEWIFILPFAVSGLVVFEVWKLVRRKKT
ncbi:cation-translocating P-type ATPase [Nanoarchaeota archaeon]